MNDILKGDWVKLCAVDQQELGRAYDRWNQDSELTRLMDARTASLNSAKAISNSFEKELEREALMHHFFTIRSLDEDRLLGDVNLAVINHWSGRDAFLGIAIGDRNDWGRGFGTDAVKIILRFAFTEVNLRRVSLTVFEYNLRAIRSYEKAGFKPEGRLRGAILREGKRWDIHYMGVLCEEWMERNQ